LKDLKAIIWDWGGVFCVAGEHFSNQRMLEQAGMTPEQMSDSSKDIEREFYLGEISEAEFWNRIIEKYSLKGISREDLRKSYFESYRPYPEIIDIAKKVRQNYKTALLSNLAVDMSERIRKLHGIDNLFEIKIFSHEVGMMKPDERIYNLMLDKLQLKPQECLFIDDSKTNTDAAERLGINTIHFKTPEQAISEMRSRGLF